MSEDTNGIENKIFLAWKCDCKKNPKKSKNTLQLAPISRKRMLFHSQTEQFYMSLAYFNILELSRFVLHHSGILFP